MEFNRKTLTLSNNPRLSCMSSQTSNADLGCPVGYGVTLGGQVACKQRVGWQQRERIGKDLELEWPRDRMSAKHYNHNHNDLGPITP
ncbi:hypothetical protein HPP92_025518 [Vanilla planifolia]|uniref:Uncharacterized protein n=1 Tax=Vanilla planifolia TaxID=51239 RepID=A0A835PGR9_VANPL|nr:hypothetical protein HPP92_025518 [Vanilla planifolia]